MSKRESLARYTLIIKKLKKQASTFEEIADYLDLESEIQSYNFNISKRTFLRDREDIYSLYNIDIRYDFSQKVYYIDSEDQPEDNERMLEAFDIFNALNLTDRLSGHIHFEKRRPQGTEHLYGLLHAIKNHLQVKFTYEKFWEEEFTSRMVEPYALKEFKNLWYVLAKDSKDNNIKTFALDRISELDILKKKFQFPKDFDVNKQFQNCFGIISPNEDKVQDIILSFDPYQGKYLKKMPLHHTQEILIDNEEELQIQLKIYITHDFVMELLSYGQNVEVISPKSLRDQLKSILYNTHKLYV